jgi:hypothetical protein
MKRVHCMLGVAGAAAAVGLVGAASLMPGAGAHGAGTSPHVGSQPKKVSMYAFLEPQTQNIRLVDFNTESPYAGSYYSSPLSVSPYLSSSSDCLPPVCE